MQLPQAAASHTQHTVQTDARAALLWSGFWRSTPHTGAPARANKRRGKGFEALARAGGKPKNGSKLHVAEFAVPVTADELESVLSKDSESRLSYQSVKLYLTTSDTVAAAVFQLEAEKKPGDIWFLLQKGLKLAPAVAVDAITIYRLKFADAGRKQAPLAKVYWQYLQLSTGRQHDLLVLDGAVVSRSGRATSTVAGGAVELLDVAPALSEATDSSSVPLRSDDYDGSFADLLQLPLDSSSSSSSSTVPIITDTLLDETEYSPSSAKRARTVDTTFSI
eukprot:8433-Heterococcus_DN1.PRE.1